MRTEESKRNPHFLPLRPSALSAILLLLVLTGPATAQESVREVPCENGTAGGYACDRIDLLSHLSRHELGAADSILLNDIWGWTDPQTDREYALVGRRGTARNAGVRPAAAPGRNRTP